MNGKSVVVVGGSRGLGLGVAGAARAAGARVTVVARGISPADGVPGDATDELFAAKVLAEQRPDLLVITAGAAPEMLPLTGHTWESFSVNWHSDVRIAFTWLRAALTLPLAPGSRVVVFGSAAELRGSPLSGGYAGAKATVRLIAGYAAGEARDLGITVTTVLPGITPGTGVGETAIRAYAKASKISRDEFTARLTAAATPESTGRDILALTGTDPAYLIDADGWRPLPAA
ncbi:SDR family oxidoreductase [Actinoplanes palleronii]|uniref:Short-chain dehydrogenase n=1 Tax=Actinoplanes palleronii TaxID=113570 RepID=A0ABQ4BSV6_9ACTN|nr:SDR family oxidoreductase [Actinoplanes palleronii]GIE73270.1 short-chain dehydrogenase [Actinoplanes palleronii]